MLQKRTFAQLLCVVALASLWPAPGVSAQGRPNDKVAPEAEIARLLNLREGSALADVGSGDGEWTLDFARRVGPEGRIFSTEIDPALLSGLRTKIENDGLRNVTLVLGGPKESGLPAGSCDAILLRLVYHHLTDPADMRSSLVRALRPDGRLAVIDFKPGSLRPVKGVPENRGGHGIQPDLVVRELTEAGLVLVERIEAWEGEKERFCLVFRR